MKKFLSVMLIAVIAVSSVFAMSGYIGASSGYGFRYMKGAEDKTTQVGTYVPVSIDGSTYFGKKDFKIGLSYGAEITQIPLTLKMGSLSVDREASEYVWTLAPYAGLSFRYDFGKSFALAGSVNATFDWGSAKNYAKRFYPAAALEDMIPDTITHKTIGMMGNLYVNVTMGSVNLRAGGLVKGPIGSWTTEEIAGNKITSDMEDMTKTGMFDVVPFIGIGFAY